MRKNQPLQSDTLSFSLPLDLFYISQLPYDNTLLQRDLIEEFRWEYSIMFPFVKNKEELEKFYSTLQTVFEHLRTTTRLLPLTLSELALQLETSNTNDELQNP